MRQVDSGESCTWQELRQLEGQLRFDADTEFGAPACSVQIRDSEHSRGAIWGEFGQSSQSLFHPSQSNLIVHPQ